MVKLAESNDCVNNLIQLICINNTGYLIHGDDHDEWWIVFVVWLTEEKRLALFPAGTTIKDPHHRKSPTRRKQDLNLRRTWVHAFLNEVEQ